MFKNIIYAFNKLDYFYFLILSILIFSILVNTKLFNLDNIIPVIVTMFIVYLLTYKKIFNTFSKMELNNNKLKQIQIYKYPHLKNDIYVIDCIDKLYNLQFLNRTKFNQMLKHIDKFFYYYEQSKNINLKPYDLYISAKDNSKRALNILKSFVLDMHKYPFLEGDRNISTGFVSENNNIIETRETLKDRFSLYLTEMETKINNDWKKGNINIYSQPVYPDEPDGITHTDVLHSDLYNIY